MAQKVVVWCTDQPWQCLGHPTACATTILHKGVKSGTCAEALRFTDTNMLPGMLPYVSEDQFGALQLVPRDNTFLRLIFQYLVRAASRHPQVTHQYRLFELGVMTQRQNPFHKR